MKKLGWFICFILISATIQVFYKWLFGSSPASVLVSSWIISFYVTLNLFSDYDFETERVYVEYDLKEGKKFEIKNNVYQKEYKGLLLECVDKECNRYGNLDMYSEHLKYFSTSEILHFQISDESMLRHLEKYSKDLNYKFDDIPINHKLANDISEQLIRSFFEKHQIPDMFKSKIFMSYFLIDSHFVFRHYRGLINFKYIP